MAKVERIDKRPPTLNEGAPSPASVQQRRDVVQRFRQLPPQTRHIGAPIQTFVRNLPVVGKNLSDMMNEGDETAIEGYRAENPIASFGARAAGHSVPYVLGGPASVGGRMAYGGLIEGSDALSEGEDPIVGGTIGAIGGALASAPGRAITPRNSASVARETATRAARRTQMVNDAFNLITTRTRDPVPEHLREIAPFISSIRSNYRSNVEHMIRSEGDALVRAANSDPRYVYNLRQYLGRVDPNQPNYGAALDEARRTFENANVRNRVSRRDITDRYHDRIRKNLDKALEKYFHREINQRNLSISNIPPWIRGFGAGLTGHAMGYNPAASAAIGLLAGPAERAVQGGVNRVINNRSFDNWYRNQVLPHGSPVEQTMFGGAMGGATAGGATPGELAPELKPYEAILSQLKGMQ